MTGRAPGGRAAPLVAALAAWLAAPLAGQPPFVDATAEAGLDFVHFNGMSGEFYFPEMTGGGGALVDYDNDGDLDLFLVQGTMLGPGKTAADAIFPPPAGGPPGDRLYRNDLVAGPGGAPAARFVDVTERAGIVEAGYGMGVAAGDYDGDGWTDLYVTNFGSNALWRNLGDGRFRDVTAATGSDDRRWSVAASFADYDGDGRLDLFVANYVDFSFAVHKICPLPTGERDYCGPLAYDPVPDRLFRNRGDGGFEDVSAAAGIAAQAGAALGLVAADLDGDRRTDFYVANDGSANFLWLNQGDGTFRDEALLAGSAFNRAGQPEASMGVAAADFDGDGDEDLFMAHLTGETNTLYRNDGRGLFRDDTVASGLGSPSWTMTGFGVVPLDYDRDGRLDLLVANGAVKTIEALARRRDPYPLHQPNQLFRNLDGMSFADVTAGAGEAFSRSEVSRGVAVGDVDRDGDPDAVVVNNAGPARLLLNRVAGGGWLGVALAEGGRGAWGARAELAGDPRQWRRVAADGGFASAHDPWPLFGFAGEPPARLRLHWPDGRRRELRVPPAGRYLVVAR